MSETVNKTQVSDPEPLGPGLITLPWELIQQTLVSFGFGLWF